MKIQTKFKVIRAGGTRSLLATMHKLQDCWGLYFFQMTQNGVCIRSVFEQKIGPYKVCIFVNMGPYEKLAALQYLSTFLEFLMPGRRGYLPMLWHFLSSSLSSSEEGNETLFLEGYKTSSCTSQAKRMSAVSYTLRLRPGILLCSYLFTDHGVGIVKVRDVVRIVQDFTITSRVIS